MFETEAGDVPSESVQEYVNTDGWAATHNASLRWFVQVTVVLCFLHRFSKIRDRSRKTRERHRRVWDVYHAATWEAFRRPMAELQRWCATPAWDGSLSEMLTKLWNKAGVYPIAIAHPGCHRMSK